jgi:predicted RecA/RadA family phage recombinase
MSTNQVQPGKSVLVTAGGTVASGSVQEVGSDFIGVALGAATNGTDYQLALEGVFNIAQKDERDLVAGRQNLLGFERCHGEQDLCRWRGGCVHRRRHGGGCGQRRHWPGQAARWR